MSQSTNDRPTNVRLVVLAALSAGAILSYLLRVCISTAGTTIQRELLLSDAVLGDIFSAFFLGYFWCQIPGGWIGGKFGARLSLGAMGLLWAAATVLSAVSQSSTLLYCSRIALGVAQAGLFPVTIMAIRDWFPSRRHGLASSLITACMSAGAVLASALTTRLLFRFGWRGTFILYAVLAVAWAVWFLVWFRDKPGLHRSVNKAELDLIGEPSQAKPEPVDADLPRPGKRPPLVAMLLSPPMWALNAQAYFQAFGYAVFITWFPAYLEKGRGVSPTGAGDLTILPLLTIVIGSVVGGQLIDVILKRTGSRWMSRSVLPFAGLALCALAVLIATRITVPAGAVAMIATGMFFAGIAMPGKWACTIDLTGPYSATGFALMNMAGNIGAWMCPKVVGRMFQGLDKGVGDWNSFLYLIAGIFLAAAISCLVLNPNKPAIRADA